MSEIHIDMSDFDEFADRVQRMRANLDQEFQLFLEGLGMDLLRIVHEEIIRREVVDNRQLLDSFKKNDDDNVWVMEEGGLRLEVGSALEYSRYVNDGHWLNPKGVKERFVPGYWDGDTFVYVPYKALRAKVTNSMANTSTSNNARKRQVSAIGLKRRIIETQPFRNRHPGMVLKQKWINARPYWDSALMILNRMFPGLMQAKMDQWLEKYFGTA